MLSKLLRTMLPAVEPWVVPGENVENPGGIMNANPLDTLSSEYPSGATGCVFSRCYRSRTPAQAATTLAEQAGLWAGYLLGGVK